MHEKKFSPWQSWALREELKGLEFPGVYVIALSNRRSSGREFRWKRGIIDIGMTNAVMGLKGRLKQFDNQLLGKGGHGGADRVRFRHRNYAGLVRRLSVSVAPFKCDVTSNRPVDLIIMGDVAKFEYTCLAQYVEHFNKPPEFNDKKESPKFSKAIGKTQ
jgi:hypothetical protein